MKGNVDYLEMIALSKTHSVMEVAIAASLIKAIARGDYMTIEHILQRIVGKIPDEIHIKSRNLNANIDVEKYNDENLKARLAKIRTDI